MQKDSSSSDRPQSASASNSPTPSQPTPPAEKPSVAASKGNPAQTAANTPQPTEVAADASPEANAAPADSSAAASRRGRRFLLLNAVPSWLVSMVVHAVLLMLMALATFSPHELRKVTELLAVNDRPVEEIEEIEIEEIEPLDVQTFQDVAPSDATVSASLEPAEMTSLTVANDLEAAPMSIELDSFSEQLAPKSDLLREVGALSGDAFSGRGSAAVRSEMLAKYGGNEASERAVASALKWLAAHQLPDGGWSFDHQRHPGCQGRCTDAGTMDNARVGATAMALLPFLGAGQTHLEGAYKKNVEAGLYFLVKNMRVRNGMGELWEEGGQMYSHGLASIVLCEAYGMTQDKALANPAQLSLNFIVYAQDPVGGGWRYRPKQPGDTSVVGWQLMALKSGHISYLQVPPNVVVGANRFLDSVSAENGAKYGYTGPQGTPSTTAIGLLCRMYLGWKREHPAMQQGVQYLSQTGFRPEDLYYSYYATQVMRHNGGDEWEKWNSQMRDALVNAQSKDGHMAGSWFIRGPHGPEPGGRLYCTSMAAMILEVYYRHMPIYGKQAAEEEFPL